MHHVRPCVSLLALSALFCCGTASAGSIGTTFAVGYTSWDITVPGDTGEFDVVNQTGPNSSIAPDITFPVSSSLNFSSLSLSVTFVGGSTEVFGSSDFTLIGDGLSYDGPALGIGGTNPLPTSATLTGDFSPLTVTLNDGSVVTIDSTFSATISPDLGDTTLVDGDLAVIYASTSTTTGSTPEPGTWLLAVTGVLGLALSRYRKPLGKMLSKSAPFGAKAGAVVLCLVLGGSAFAVAPPAVHLNVWTTPDNGLAGTSNVNVTASGVPSGTITPRNVVVTISTSCGGPVSATTHANTVIPIVGTAMRFDFTLPASLTTKGDYFVTVADSTSGDVNFASANCSEVNVGVPPPTLSCIPSSSLAVLVPTTAPPVTVTAYVPNGCWECGSTGLSSVVIEGTPATASISTPNVVNSCASNPLSGLTVCTANNTDVYLITGSTLNKTLTSGATGSAGFSGGSCENCGLAINAVDNTAYISMGLSTSPSGSGIQALDLSTNTFATPASSKYIVSEDISVDPGRALILSPGEGGSYDLFQVGGSGALTEFTNYQGDDFDSAAEDCTTGIALASDEFSDAVFLVDLTQAKFTPGSPGTWTAPSQLQTLVTNYSFSAGTDGISVAPGSHLGVITGEFGGNVFAVLSLPATSGSGTPALVDYAVAQIPSLSACGGGFSSGKDPHTVTAYTSPNTGKAYALFANAAPPTCVVQVDLAAVLAAPRGGAGLQAHDVSAANFPAGAAVGISTF
jgi:hypothetical protein